jgi:hypothetical protein
LSMPLARSSALDHRFRPALAGGRRPTWRSFGARRSGRFAKNHRLKPLPIAQRSLTGAKRGRTFLSRAGPRGSVGLLQAGHRLSDCFDCSWNDEGDPLGSPSLRAAMRLGD